MRFHCQIDMDNAAFEDDSGAELARILTRMAKQAAEGQTGMGVVDANGNRVGQWVIEGDDNCE